MDVAKVCEDAVTVVATAYKFHASSSDQPLYRVFFHSELGPNQDERAKNSVNDIAVILNMEKADWRLLGHRGSIQRIVMNLVGNSLKYTHSGFVKVALSLQAQNIHENQDSVVGRETAIVKLVVSDSGRGISSDFLKTKLFSAFSQESTLAPGTGMFIVKRNVGLSC